MRAFGRSIDSKTRPSKLLPAGANTCMDETGRVKGLFVPEHLKRAECKRIVVLECPSLRKHVALTSRSQLPLHEEGRPSANRNEAPTEMPVPITKSISGVKSCRRIDDMTQVRMMDSAVLKQPWVAPAYFSITAHKRPPNAFIPMTKSTRMLYPV
mmetsp:Transcript_11028/g.20773  ORF Transcript_11028/g.20773 Transcript_11028/m.20773 type:complete len:155 (+) Transcript_11028:50-514(+)